MTTKQQISIGIICGVIIIVLTMMVGYLWGKNACLAKVVAAPVVSTNAVTNAITAAMTNAPVVAAPVPAAPAVVSSPMDTNSVPAVAQQLEALRAEVQKLRKERANVVIKNHIGVDARPPTPAPVPAAAPAPTPSSPAWKPSARGTVGNGGQRGVIKVANRSETVTTVVTNGVTTGVVTVANTSEQSFLKPKRRWSLLGLLIGEKDPIPTAVPSGHSVGNGHPQPPVVVVEQPSYYGGYYPPYGGYGYPYTRSYYGGGGYRELLGVRYKSSN